MENSEIAKALADFEAKVAPGVKTTATKPKTKLKDPAASAILVATPEPAPVLGEAGPPCVNKVFKEMVKSLSIGFIGSESAKMLLLEILDTQIPECN
jgi:hypothetical protein